MAECVRVGVEGGGSAVVVVVVVVMESNIKQRGLTVGTNNECYLGRD